MEKHENVTETLINIRTLVHSSTGALMAVSDDLDGFMVAGKTYAEIRRKLEGALRDHFELLGHELLSVTFTPEKDNEVGGFESTLPAFIARAAIEEKHSA